MEYTLIKVDDFPEHTHVKIDSDYDPTTAQVYIGDRDPATDYVMMDADHLDDLIEFLQGVVADLRNI